MTSAISPLRPRFSGQVSVKVSDLDRSDSFHGNPERDPKRPQALADQDTFQRVADEVGAVVKAKPGDYPLVGIEITTWRGHTNARAYVKGVLPPKEYAEAPGRKLVLSPMGFVNYQEHPHNEETPEQYKERLLAEVETIDTLMQQG